MFFQEVELLNSTNQPSALKKSTTSTPAATRNTRNIITNKCFFIRSMFKL